MEARPAFNVVKRHAWALLFWALFGLAWLMRRR